MNKNSKWLLAVGVAAMITANGLAMAAVGPVPADAGNGTKQAAFDKREGKGKAFKEDYNKLLALLKIDDKTFKEEMKAGKTLAAVAQEQGVSEQELQTFLENQITQRLETEEKSGRLTADQAATMKSGMPELVAKMMNGTGPLHHGPRAGHAPFANDKMLAFLNIDADTLRNELKTEKTLVAVAGKHGVSEQELKEFLLAQMTERLDAGVQAGRLTAEQADGMKANMEERVTKMINAEGLMHREHGPLPKSEQQADS
ncbi:hypothetical protein [Sporomusa termitida]|uniref:Uncharacterized protein n=1 Tax=Sporomusa termitida TaxID=2377 RepID=A0A517DY90_9FIRM|nr:hypothetical protein [Sporomusa termitida]QDR82303.1 hypothetical protein SPTER_37280 [Sporomusa termitida]